MSDPIRVLIVSNSEADVARFVGQLENDFFEVRSCRVENADQLQLALACGQWNVILSDYTLTAFTGLEALAIAGKLAVDLPFLFIADAAGENLAVSAIKSGACDWILKCDLSRLGAAVRAEMRAAGKRSQRRHEQLMLCRSEERFRAMADFAPVLIWITNPHNNAFWFNESWLAFTGSRQKEEVEPKWYTYIHPDDVGVVRETHDRCIPAREECRNEYRLRRNNGEYCWMLDHGVPLSNAVGEFLGYMNCAVDITSKKQQQQELILKAEQLYESNVELERFAYVAAHDLQEPLRMTGTYSQLLVRTVQQASGHNPDLAEYSEYVVGGVQRMQDLIGGLLTYSKVVHDAEQMIASVDMNEVIKSLLTEFRQMAEPIGATITFDLLPTIQADKIQVTQVFQNLLSNALKYHAKKVAPRVHVSATRQDSAWKFSVTDNGIGIAPEHQDRIFAIFRRLHRDEYPGVGIGLAASKRLVEMRGGQIGVCSEPGRGSTFYFTVPFREIDGNAARAQAFHAQLS